MATTGSKLTDVETREMDASLLASSLAEVLRHLCRAMVNATSTQALANAERHLSMFLGRLGETAKAGEVFKFRELFEPAIAAFRRDEERQARLDNVDPDRPEHRLAYLNVLRRDAALAGLALVVEESCLAGDAAASGRSAKAARKFEAAMGAYQKLWNSPVKEHHFGRPKAKA